VTGSTGAVSISLSSSSDWMIPSLVTRGFTPCNSTRSRARSPSSSISPSAFRASSIGVTFSLFACARSAVAAAISGVGSGAVAASASNSRAVVSGFGCGSEIDASRETSDGQASEFLEEDARALNLARLPIPLGAAEAGGILTQAMTPWKTDVEVEIGSRVQ
jgi:hypothetical protein